MRSRHRGSPFLDQIRNAIPVSHYSMRTEEGYLGWIKRFILFHGEHHPRDMAEPEVTAFLRHLALLCHPSAGTRHGYSDCARAARPSRPAHDADLYPRAPTGRQRRDQPTERVAPGISREEGFGAKDGAGAYWMMVGWPIEPRQRGVDGGVMRGE